MLNTYSNRVSENPVSSVRKLGNREIEALHASRIAPEALRSCSVWLHNIRSMHNVGSVFRTCDAFGVGMILLSGFTPAPPRPEISKAALGADEYVPWLYFNAPEDVLRWLNENRFTLCSIEQTTASASIFTLHSINRAQKTCFLFGNEVNGIDESLLAKSQHVFDIPQFGRKHSLNIAVSAGIVLFQYLSGFYSHAGDAENSCK
jgi:tRNA G18 (ribose-2'-O)-methylase SpoU